MVDLKNVHHICIGYNQHIDLMFNREIIRHNFPNGKDLWLTVVYNGDLDKVPSGVGENTFIKIEDNKGYAYGALDAINVGLNFALEGYRDIIVLTNFDGYFFSEDKYKTLIDEFIDSGKPFSSGYHQSHDMPLTDLMLFKKDFLQKLLPISAEVYPARKEVEFLQKEYEGTQLGFHNVEEWVLNALHRLGDLDELWHRMQRDGHPRYRYTEKYAFGHLHDNGEKKMYMKQNNVSSGSIIEAFMRS